MGTSDAKSSPNGPRPVAHFEICYHQFLDQEGTIVRPLPEFARETETLVPLYRWMMLTRSFDAKATVLQRTGQLGTYASSLGQEAIGVAIGSTMLPEDVLLPSYRETAAMLVRGVRMSEVLLYWGGDERGMDYAGPREDLPISVPVASHAPHAVGLAYAFKYRREPRVAVCCLGDGASSKGDFYEALNAAGVWELPVVFVVSNNHWAISVPRSIQSRAQTLAQKAIAAGIEGEQVDGNDLIAMLESMQRALAKARNGGGPHLIEALTYRLGDHTTADDARRYREEREVAEQTLRDPVERLRKYLIKKQVWSEPQEAELQSECRADVESAVSEYLQTPAPPPTSMFDHLFETLPAALREQRAAVAKAMQDDG